MPAAGNAFRDGGNSAEVLIEWNQLLQGTIPASAGLGSARLYSMLHVAMFDAVNSIEAEYSPYVARVRGSHGASAEAAAAQAGHDILVALIPASAPAYDAALAARLATIPAGLSAQGVAVGSEAAANVLAWRQNDGWGVALPPYEPPAIPGLWQRTPPFGPASFTQFPAVRPFALPSPTLFLPPSPPMLNSEKYAQDFNEVKLMGSATSAVRTTEQTLRSRLFAAVVSRTTLWAMWNNVARDMIRSNRLSLVEAARLFALMNVAINDGVQTSHTSKFVYGLWRPVTAIRRADEDLNLATDPDSTWTPLLTTPTYPAYAGNMATVGASAAAVLRLLLGPDDRPFTVLWQGTAGQPDVSRDFASFAELAEAQAMSRLHGGIHFDFDNRAGQQIGDRVGRYVVDHFAIPRTGDPD
jgi:hypothetical protein